MKKIDCLFINVPKFNNWYKPFGEYMYIKSIPVGLLAMADFLNKKGYSSEIVHLGVEIINNKNFDLIEYIREAETKVIGFSLHWHHQSYDVIEVARKAKKKLPQIYIVLGGFTASFFADEIMHNYGFVDGIIRGDGEIPMLYFVQEASEAMPNFQNVPNLIWRNKDALERNEISYIASKEDLNKLDFMNFRLLKNWKTYVNIFGCSPSFYLKNASKRFNTMRRKKPLVPLGIGRGCSVNCRWCGGSRNAHKLISCREKSIFRSVNRIISDIKQAKEYGFKIFHIAFYAHPSEDKYFVNLFRKIKEDGLNVGVYFECSTLPTKPLIDEFALTFSNSNKSYLCLSRLTFSEKIRKLNIGSYYSNQELFETLEYINKKRIAVELFFSMGLSGEKEYDLKQLFEFHKRILRKFKCITRSSVLTSELEPASFRFMYPEKYGIKTDIKTFSDFYKFHKNEKTSCFTNLGYRIPNYFNDSQICKDIEFEEKIQAIRCKKFCQLNANGKWYDPIWSGRVKCNMLNLFWRLKSSARNMKKSYLRLTSKL